MKVRDGHDRTRTMVIGVVTGVWTINFFLTAFLDGYEPYSEINAIFMGIVGGLFAIGSKKKDDPDE